MKTNIAYSMLAALCLVCPDLSFACGSRATAAGPDGGYINGNTAEGDKALSNLTDGIFNTAVGFQAMIENTTGGEIRPLEIKRCATACRATGTRQSEQSRYRIMTPTTIRPAVILR